MGRWTSDITNSLARVAALAGLFSLVLTVIGQLLGTLWWPVELASHFVPFYAALLLIACPVLLRHPQQRRPRLALCCGVALLWNIALLWPCFTPHPSSTQSGPSLQILSLNVHTSNQQHQAVLDLITAHDPDVVMLYEVDQRWIDALGSLVTRYPAMVLKPRSDNFGIAVYTRLPVVSSAIIQLGSTELPSVELAAVLRGEPVMLLATHPLPPIGAANAKARNNQLRAVADWTAEQDAPMVVAGDLNVTRWSPYFRRLLSKSGLRDSSQGEGLIATWHPIRWLPGIPIDHVLCSPEWSVQQHKVGPDVGSDHRPVIAELTMPSW